MKLAGELFGIGPRFPEKNGPGPEDFLPGG